MSYPARFLKRYSGKIVSLGDTFDLHRSNVRKESAEDYILRTRPYWKHIDKFIIGNHDAGFLRRYDCFKPQEFFKEGTVLALHGHQIGLSFDHMKVKEYESKWDTYISIESMFWDVEEWACRTFNRFFSLHGKKAYYQALVTLRALDHRGLLDNEVEIVITGHSHLPYKKHVEYKGKTYKVINVGSALQGKRFRPVYIREIGKWFVSDLHLGTAKSKLE